MRDRPVVMVVEDDAEMNDLERELLAVNGLDAFPAYTGAEALEVFDPLKTDAVLMDVMLPEMDGFEACRKLRCINGVPIIIVSALDSEDCRRRGFEVGANSYFTKPFDPDEIVSMIRKLIGQNGNGA
jgi:DNA-binding response OmpR family regulator